MALPPSQQPQPSWDPGTKPSFGASRRRKVQTLGKRRCHHGPFVLRMHGSMLQNRKGAGTVTNKINSRWWEELWSGLLVPWWSEGEWKFFQFKSLTKPRFEITLKCLELVSTEYLFRNSLLHQASPHSLLSPDPPETWWHWFRVASTSTHRFGGCETSPTISMAHFT